MPVRALKMASTSEIVDLLNLRIADAERAFIERMSADLYCDPMRATNLWWRSAPVGLHSSEELNRFARSLFGATAS
jgi:hypothetical protein